MNTLDRMMRPNDLRSDSCVLTYMCLLTYVHTCMTLQEVCKSGLTRGTSGHDHGPSNSITFTTNLLGPYLLTRLLFDTLARTPNARVINLTSDLAAYGETDWQAALGQERSVTCVHMCV